MMQLLRDCAAALGRVRDEFNAWADFLKSAREQAQTNLGVEQPKLEDKREKKR